MIFLLFSLLMTNIKGKYTIQTMNYSTTISFLENYYGPNVKNVVRPITRGKEEIFGYSCDPYEQDCPSGVKIKQHAPMTTARVVITENICDKLHNDSNTKDYYQEKLKILEKQTKTRKAFVKTLWKSFFPAKELKDINLLIEKSPDQILLTFCKTAYWQVLE